MRFTCTVSEMTAALSTVTRAIAARTTVQIMEGVLLATCEGQLSLTCTDVGLGIETRVPVDIKSEGKAVLPGKLLLEIVRKLPQEENLDLTIDEKNSALLRCLKSKTTLAGLPADEYPALPEVSEAQQIEMPQKALRSMIQNTTFAIATDETRPILMGCLLETNENCFTIVALDGFRLALRKFYVECAMPKLSLVVPGKALNEIARILDDTEQPSLLQYGKTHLSVTIGETRVIARLMEGEFIKYSQILPTEWQTSITVEKEELMAAVDRASLMAREGKNNLIKMHIEEGTLLITSNAETGDVREEIPVDFEGRALDIAFNVRYISDTMRAIEDEHMVLRFNSNVSPCVICPTSGDHFLYLALPVRVFSA